MRLTSTLPVTLLLAYAVYGTDSDISDFNIESHSPRNVLATDSELDDEDGGREYLMQSFGMANSADAELSAVPPALGSSLISLSSNPAPKARVHPGRPNYSGIHPHSLSKNGQPSSALRMDVLQQAVSAFVKARVHSLVSVAEHVKSATRKLVLSSTRLVDGSLPTWAVGLISAAIAIAVFGLAYMGYRYYLWRPKRRPLKSTMSLKGGNATTDDAVSSDNSPTGAKSGSGTSNTPVASRPANMPLLNQRTAHPAP